MGVNIAFNVGVADAARDGIADAAIDGWDDTTRDGWDDGRPDGTVVELGPPLGTELGELFLIPPPQTQHAVLAVLAKLAYK